jgi:hypothetical protein
MIVRQNLPMAVRVNVVPMRRRRGIGDAVSDAAAAADAIRGGAGYPQIALCPWSGDSSWADDPAGQVLYRFLGPSASFNVKYASMTADGWAYTINDSASEGAGSSAAALNGRVGPGTSQLGITKEQLGCQYDMELTLDQYWAAFKSYNAGTWHPPGQMCGPSNPTYGPTSSVLYPNVYISPTWSGNAAPAGVTDATVQAQYAATQAAGSGSSSQGSVKGSLTFSTPRSGGVLYPGDAWTIKISGATPNSPVAVTGNGSAATYGTNITTPMGTTDSSGNWALSGSIDSTQIGQWYENWSVGGQSVGSFTFTVQAAPSGSEATGGTTSVSSTGNWLTDSMFGGIPNWGLLAGAAVAAFAFSSGGKR